jgi:phosphoribosylformimino-5-aminoimidazole carboxamide ribotide isomerase
MRFRPCIDLRDGAVVQIVGSTLEAGAAAAADGAAPAAAAAAVTTNFTATQPSPHFAALYRRDALPGGHIIMLGGGAANEAAALAALGAYPGGMQVGGGVTPANAPALLAAGASHVIVTSYVFREGRIDWARLEELTAAVGKERLVLDLSARKRRRGGDAEGSSAASGDGEEAFEYVVMTDRWKTWTQEAVTPALLAALGDKCAELLVHAVDVEGKRCGVEEGLVRLLGRHAALPVTYAGGVRDMADVERVRQLGSGRVDVCIGSALDIFGGSLAYAELVAWQRAEEAAAAAAAAGVAGAGGAAAGAAAESK